MDPPWYRESIESDEAGWGDESAPRSRKYRGASLDLRTDLRIYLDIFLSPSSDF